MLKGVHVAITGILGFYKRAEAFSQICDRGGIPQETVTKETDILVVGYYRRNSIGEPHEKWTAVYLSVDMRRMEAGQKSELNSWGSSTPKPLDSVRFGDTSAVPQKRAACPKITRLLSGRK